jgi:hypothetical protein
MAEVWYLEMDTATLKTMEPRYRLEFKECIEVFKLSPERRKCGPDKILTLRQEIHLDQIGYIRCTSKSYTG